MGIWGGCKGIVSRCGDAVWTLTGSSLAERTPFPHPPWLQGGGGYPTGMERREETWLHPPAITPRSPGALPAGKSEVEQWSDMYTVTSQLVLKVGREDDGVPVICLVDHPAVKDLQTQRYLEVMCE